MGWHTDGHASGEFIGHYYLRPAPEVPESVASSSVSPECELCSTMSWFELALPPLDESADDDDDDELRYAVAFDSGEVQRTIALSLGRVAPHRSLRGPASRLVAQSVRPVPQQRQQQISRSCFLPVEFESKLVLFEDAKASLDRECAISMSRVLATSLSKPAHHSFAGLPSHAAHCIRT